MEGFYFGMFIGILACIFGAFTGSVIMCFVLVREINKIKQKYID